MNRGTSASLWRIPTVPFLIPMNSQAAWAGKWSCNWDCDSIRKAGGPWNSLDDACSAIMATGLYARRPNSNPPHFDDIK